MMAGMLEKIAPVLTQRKDSFVLSTMAAGLTCEDIQRLSGVQAPVIRIMPNTPAAIGAGVVQYCSKDADQQQVEDYVSLIAPAGLVDPIAENLIDAASGVSGCGPAFAYMFVEALADGGVACGLPRDKAQLYAAMTVAGAAEMVLKSGQHPGALKDAVCSPGGSTIAGVRALEQGGFRAAAMDCVVAGYQRNKELGKQ